MVSFDTLFAMLHWVVYFVVVCALVLITRWFVIHLYKRQTSHLRDDTKLPLLCSFKTVNIL